MIELRNLSVNYNGHYALKNINIVIDDYEKVTILGPNGSGKTTLLKAMVNLVKFEGEIFVKGKSLSGISRAEVARHIAYVPQIFASPFSFTVKEFVAMGLYSRVRDWWRDDDAILRALRTTGIESLKDKYISNISGGELQKCLIARALVQDSFLIAMDEPMAHLDIKAVLELSTIISSLENKGVIVVTHDINFLNKIKGKILLLKKGEVNFFGDRSDQNFTSMLEDTFEVSVKEVNDMYFVSKK